MLQQGFEKILANVLAQPRGYVHRDYHSRNLKITTPEDLIMLRILLGMKPADVE